MVPMLRALVIREGVHVIQMQGDSLWFQWRPTFQFASAHRLHRHGGWLVSQEKLQEKGQEWVWSVKAKGRAGAGEECSVESPGSQVCLHVLCRCGPCQTTAVSKIFKTEAAQNVGCPIPHRYQVIPSLQFRRQ